jgi:hypothetical protein
MLNVAHIGEMMNIYKILFGNSEEKILLVRPGRR